MGVARQGLVFAFICAVLLIAGCTFFQPPNEVGAGNLSIQGDLSKGIITKALFKNISSQNISSYKYKALDKTGATLWNDSYGNRMDKQTNSFLDCGMLDCQLKTNISPSKKLTIDSDFIKAFCTDLRITFGKPFFYDTREVQRTIEVWGIENSTIAECALDNKTMEEKCANKTVENPVFLGNEFFWENETFENTNLTSINSSMQIITNMHKPTKGINADCWYIIGGQERKDAAWWNDTCTTIIPADVNTTVASTLTDFPATLYINTSSIAWNNTTCTNVHFLDSTNSTELYYELENNASSVCGNATNNATFYVNNNYTGGVLNRMYAYLCPLGSASNENKIMTWYPAGYVAVMHMQNGVDSMGGQTFTIGAQAEPTTDRNGVPNSAYLFNSSATTLFNRTQTNLTDKVTANIFAIFKPRSVVPSSYRMVVQIYTGGTSQYVRGIGAEGNSGGYCAGGNNYTKVNVVTAGTQSDVCLARGSNFVNVWQYVHSDWNSTNTTIKGYNNGSSMGAKSYSGTGSNYAALFMIGGYPATANYGLNSTIDEVRLSNVARSTDWMIAEYAQTARVGQEQTIAPMMRTATILPSPAYTNASLQGWCNATTYDGTNATYNYSWFNNSVLFSSGQYPPSTAAASAVGGTITTDGAYTIHTFKSSSTFNVTGGMNVEIIVVAGGGGGGSSLSTIAGKAAGGGGAGGLLYNASLAVSGGSYGVNIGNGGAGSTTRAVNGANGTNSSFSNSTFNMSARGGGGGGSAIDGISTPENQGSAGGSGGGGVGSYYPYGSIGGAGTGGQGYDGGNGSFSGGNTRGGGGGGGSNQTGMNGTASTNGGNGGAGSTYNINGSSFCYAGGGGGGSNSGANTQGNGSCGGGNGGVAASGVAATANTGGGGGGAGGDTSGKNGGNGGSGIVIIRYIATSATTGNTTQGVNVNVANVSNTSLATCQNWTLQCLAYNANGASAAMNSSIMTISPCGASDTKTWIWNGSVWLAFTNQLNYRCSNPFPSYCQPVNQNNATGQAIFRDQNNGSTSSAWQAISTNATWATASLICGTSTNPFFNTNVSPANTSKNYSTSALAVGENNSVYCHFYIVSVPADFERDFTVNFTKG
jgi:hypothetical protein